MLLFHLSLPFYLENPIFCTGWFCSTPKYILTKYWDAEIDIFDIIEKKIVILCFGNVSIRYNINDCVPKKTIWTLKFNKIYFTASITFKIIN